MDEHERVLIEQYIKDQERLMGNQGLTSGTITQKGYPSAPQASVYSLAEVQLVSGGMIGMTVTASPTVSKHLLESMRGTGFLHLFNAEESLMIRAEDVRAIKLTKITKE